MENKKYGHFDDANREYVITDPNTPAPWANYLGSLEYGAIITNAAGGYSFEKSGAEGRILRYVFNSFDEPGRYLYIRDNTSGDYWSASWQPRRKKARRGFAYQIPPSPRSAPCARPSSPTDALLRPPRPRAKQIGRASCRERV